MTIQPATSVAADNWALANQRYLDTELLRLRLLLKRRVLWLRQLWQGDPFQSHPGLVVSDAKADSLMAGQDSRAEADFYRTEPDAAAIGQSLIDVGREIARQAQSLAQGGQAPAIEVLVRLFGLTRFERDVLLLCLAPELDSSFERLYAYVQDDVTRKYVTPHLAFSLCGDDSDLGARESLMPNGKLRRFRLLTLESAPASSAVHSMCPMRLPERVVNYLLGVNRMSEQILQLLRILPPPIHTPAQVDLLDRLHRCIQDEGNSGSWPMVNIVGPPGSGRESLAIGLSDRMNLHLYRFDPLRLAGSSLERQEEFRLLELEAALSQFALYMDTTDVENSALSNSASPLCEVVDQLGAFLIVASRERWQTERRMITVQVSKRDTSARRALWQEALTGVEHTLNGEIEELIEQFNFGPKNISRAIADARDRARLRAPDAEPKFTADDLWRACREQAAWHLDELAQRIIPCHTWEDIILPKDVSLQLQEIAAQVSNRSKVYESWGFGAKLNRGRGISALFSGPSGTGKTLAAEILANCLNLSLYRIDLSGVVSKYIGETEKNLRKVFDAAEYTGAILFFDEADALFGKRSEVKDSHDRYANIEINYLLQRMEEYRGLAILATNMKSHLDQAFMRRLRFLVDFPFPDATHRARIWEKVFPEKAAVEPLDYAALSRLEISGGNIKNIAVNAAFLAAHDGRAITTEYVMLAARREYAKIEKLMLQSEFGTYYGMVKR